MEKQKILDNVWIRSISILFAVGLFFTLCFFLKGILISLFLAFTIAYIFDPIVDYISAKKLVFSKKCIPRGLAIGIMIIGIAFVLVALLTYTIPKTVNGIQSVGVTLKQQYPKYQDKVEKIFEEYGGTEIGMLLKSQFGIVQAIEKEVDIEGEQQENKEEIVSKEEEDSKEVEEDVAATNAPTRKSLIPEPLVKLKKYIPQAFELVLGIVKNIFQSTFGFFGIIMNIIVFGVVTVYLLKDFNNIISKGKSLLPVKEEVKISDIMSRIDGNLKAFFRGQVTVCIILSIIYGVGLAIIGVPMCYLLAILGGFGNMIPYIGIAFGLIPALVLVFLQSPDITHLLLVGLVFGIGQFLEGTVITPKIVGTKLGLNPVAIILAILICGQVLGFLGLLLAVPIASVAKVLIDEGIIKYKASKFFKGS